MTIMTMTTTTTMMMMMTMTMMMRRRLMTLAMLLVVVTMVMMLMVMSKTIPTSTTIYNSKVPIFDNFTWTMRQLLINGLDKKEFQRSMSKCHPINVLTITMYKRYFIICFECTYTHT